jgi:hypothetical protein
MTKAFFIFSYLLVGLGIGAMLDAWEMRKPIPYSSAPSGIPLLWIRRFCVGACMIVWPGFPYEFVKIIICDLRHDWRVYRRARRRFR